MRDSTPKAVFLRDYTPPPFLVEQVDLYIELDEEATVVSSRLQMRRNHDAMGVAGDLRLDGEQLELVSLKLDGKPLTERDYRLSPEALTLLVALGSTFALEVVTRINPKSNTSLEGLYLSDQLFCTQCEAQGFRRITYFPDRPDVMARYSTTLVADKSRYPVLLSNGNPVSGGDLLNNRHWMKWEDPFRKPSYLFALVAGSLECIEDRYVTGSGRRITLRIYVEPGDLDRCGHAMVSLKKAMRWDEASYGREYDLDLFMIVAVSHFNMGAMENKGLNLFNTKYILARPDTATDLDYEHIEGVIAHEYFHNWTGNRVTCRDWFQLSLKEGLTVFRDQQFSADSQSPAVRRIDAVNLLRTRQFAEDAGPLAHPVRPESYIEINNFYTLTVYEKGAEVVRMLHTLLGPEGFRKGMDLYFSRHDGQAVTCEDFVRSLEEANGVDFTQFRRWYSQAGTPELTVKSDFQPDKGVLELVISQHYPELADQPERLPLHVPVAIGFLGKGGEPLPVLALGEQAEESRHTRVLNLREREQRFLFGPLRERPVISFLRGFSAPVRVSYAQTDEELAFLLAHDTDPFTRWNAGQQLACDHIIKLSRAIQSGETPNPGFTRLTQAFQHMMANEGADLSYLALLLTLPTEEYIGSGLETVDPDALHRARQALKRDLASALRPAFIRLYQTYHRDEFDCFDAEAIGRRRLKNVCLDYLSELDDHESRQLALEQFRGCRTMTDRVAALTAIVNSCSPEKSACLDAFYRQWQGDDLVIGKWFSLQACCHLPGTLDEVLKLVKHPAFDLGKPNLVRALIGAFTQSNPVHFHVADGAGYRFLADHVIELNRLNPQIAARLLAPMTFWRRYDARRQQLMCAQLKRIADSNEISRDLYEVASKALA